MFVDTNVLVYARILEAPHHNVARQALDSALQSAEPLRISRQIIREYLSVVTRPQTWASAISLEHALSDAYRLASSFDVLEDGPAVTDRLITLCREVPVGGWQIHDANVVATMLVHGETRLLTFNDSDFRRYGDRIELIDH